MSKSFDPWLVPWPAQQQQVQQILWIQAPEHGNVWQFIGNAQSSVRASAYNMSAPLIADAPASTDLVVQGNLLFELGHLDKAEDCYRRALALKPKLAQAHFKLGNLLLKKGQLDAAEACYLQAIKCDRNFVKASYNLANLFKRQGRLTEAELNYRKVLELDPGYTDADNNLGVLLVDEERFEEAEECYRRVLALTPNNVMALNNLGIALRGRGHLAEAEQYCRLAIQFKPQYAEAYNTLGTVLKKRGLLAETEEAFRNAIAIKPLYFEALNNLAGLLGIQQRADEAEKYCREALLINPDYVSARLTLGNVLTEQGRFGEAEEAYKRALGLNPNKAEIHNGLAGALICQGKTNEAIAAFQKAVELKPDYSQAHSNLLFTLNYLSTQSPCERLRAAQRFGQSAANKVCNRFTSWSSQSSPQRLRVGLISGDLRNHVVGFFLESILGQIDPTRIELIAYPSKRATDETSQRLKRFMSAWKPIVDLDDEAAARLIHDDELHVLVDLSGHTADNRLPVFSWKPAPVQATWLGYFATTGVAEIDYLLADRTGVPETHRSQFSESVYYLPDTRLCFTPPTVAIRPSEPPASFNGYVTFGCFQNFSKLNDDVLQLWGKILALKPEARLYIQSLQLDDPAARAQLIERLRQRGIVAKRVTLQGPLEREAYLAAYAKVDLILDTFPYPGGTTTCEALWMGVPTLSLAGDTLLERQGASVLIAAGLAEWVANGKDDYVAKAIALTSDVPAIARLRRSLRQRVLGSPLFDAPRFARNLEDALWDMWSRHETQDGRIVPG